LRHFYFEAHSHSPHFVDSLDSLVWPELRCCPLWATAYLSMKLQRSIPSRISFLLGKANRLVWRELGFHWTSSRFWVLVSRSAAISWRKRTALAEIALRSWATAPGCIA